jgi:hypothetical protein
VACRRSLSDSAPEPFRGLTGLVRS